MEVVYPEKYNQPMEIRPVADAWPPFCEFPNNISVSLETDYPLDFDLLFLYSNLELNLARIAHRQACLLFRVLSYPISKEYQ